MDKERFAKLEVNVEDLKDDMKQVKGDVGDMKVSFAKVEGHIDHTQKQVERHITSDEKIITQISPLLDLMGPMAEIIQAHEYKKQKKEERLSKWRTWGLKLGVIGTGIGILVGLTKMDDILSWAKNLFSQ